MAIIHTDNAKECHNSCPLGGVRYGDWAPESHRTDQWLQHLMVNSQGNGSDKERHLYAWSVEFRDLFAVDTQDLEVGLRILKTVEARMEREAHTYGPCQSFGQYVTRVARALNCSHILFSPPPGEGNGQRGREWANGFSYQAVPLAQAVSRIDGIVHDWVHARDEELASV